MLVATLGKMPLFLLCSLSLSGSSSSPVLGEAMPLSRQSPDQHREKKKETLFYSLRLICCTLAKVVAMGDIF